MLKNMRAATQCSQWLGITGSCHWKQMSSFRVASTTSQSSGSSSTDSVGSSASGSSQNIPREYDDVAKPVLTLYTKEVCSLCDEAKETLEPAMHRFKFEQVDIEAPENTTWRQKYKYDIPVFHLNGNFLMKHKVNMKLLNRKLNELDSNS